MAAVKLAYGKRQSNSYRADAWKRSDSYLQFIRGRVCILENTGECRGKVRACHFDPWGDKGVGDKCNDRATLPMCDGHHHEQGEILGWPKFQLKYGFDGRAAVIQIYKSWHGKAKDQAMLRDLGHSFP